MSVLAPEPILLRLQSLSGFISGNLSTLSLALSRMQKPEPAGAEHIRVTVGDQKRNNINIYGRVMQQPTPRFLPCASDFEGSATSAN
jgi:hypothetical protein